MNRERKERRGINEGIEMEEWREYFMGLLGGVKSRVVRGAGRERKGEEGGEEGISRSEIKEALE